MGQTLENLQSKINTLKSNKPTQLIWKKLEIKPPISSLLQIRGCIMIEHEGYNLPHRLLELIHQQDTQISSQPRKSTSIKTPKYHHNQGHPHPSRHQNIITTRALKLKVIKT